MSLKQLKKTWNMIMMLLRVGMMIYLGYIKKKNTNIEDGIRVSKEKLDGQKTPRSE